MLPALFPSEHTSIVSHTSGPSSSATLDLSSAPRGPRGWPWRYVCDMAAGFDAMRVVKDTNPKMEREDIFTQVFHHTFKIATYNQQNQAWRAAGKKPGERECWVAAGRSENGEWSAFMRVWRGKK